MKYALILSLLLSTVLSIIICRDKISYAEQSKDLLEANSDFYETQELLNGAIKANKELEIELTKAKSDRIELERELTHLKDYRKSHDYTAVTQKEHLFINKLFDKYNVK